MHRQVGSFCGQLWSSVVMYYQVWSRVVRCSKIVGEESSGTVYDNLTTPDYK